MSKKDEYSKWAVYVLALLLVFFVQINILSLFTIFGTYPALIPLIVATVAVFEGPVGGAGFGLAAGILYDLAVSPSGGGYTLLFTIMGAAVAILAGVAFNKGFISCVASAVIALLISMSFRAVPYLIVGKATAYAVIFVAMKELAFSLIFVPLIYLLVRKIYGISRKEYV